MSESKNSPNVPESTEARTEAVQSTDIAEAVRGVHEHPALWEQHVEPVIARTARFWGGRYNVDRDEVASRTRFNVFTKFGQCSGSTDDVTAKWISGVSRNCAREVRRELNRHAVAVPMFDETGRENPALHPDVQANSADQGMAETELTKLFWSDVLPAAIDTIRSDGRRNAVAVLSAIERYHTDSATTWASLTQEITHFNTLAGRLRKKVRQHVDAERGAGTITHEEHATYVQFIDHFLYRARNRAAGGKARHAKADADAADDATEAHGHDMKKNQADDTGSEEAAGPTWIPVFDAPDKEEGLDMATAPPIDLAQFVRDHAVSPQALIARSQALGRDGLLARRHPSTTRYRAYEFSGAIAIQPDLPEEIAQVDPTTGTISIDLDRFGSCDVTVHDGSRFRVDTDGVTPLPNTFLEELNVDTSDDRWLTTFIADRHDGADPWNTAWRAGAFVRLYQPSGRGAQARFEAMMAGTSKTPREELEAWARTQPPQILASLAARATAWTRSAVEEMNHLSVEDLAEHDVIAWLAERDDVENIRCVVAAAGLSAELDAVLAPFDETGKAWLTNWDGDTNADERLSRSGIGGGDWWARGDSAD